MTGTVVPLSGLASDWDPNPVVLLLTFVATLHHPLVHDLEHASFVLAGLLVWTQLVDPARHGRLRVDQRAVRPS